MCAAEPDSHVRSESKCREDLALVLRKPVDMRADIEEHLKRDVTISQYRYLKFVEGPWSAQFHADIQGLVFDKTHWDYSHYQSMDPRRHVDLLTGEPCSDLIPENTDQPSVEAKYLFKKVALLCHPDKAANRPSDETSRDFCLVSDMHRRNDVEGLKRALAYARSHEGTLIGFVDAEENRDVTPESSLPLLEMIKYTTTAMNQPWYAWHQDPDYTLREVLVTPEEALRRLSRQTSLKNTHTTACDASIVGYSELNPFASSEPGNAI